MVKALIRMGDLSTYIEVLVQYADLNDAVFVAPLDTATSIKITFLDPDSKPVGPFNMTVVTTGADGFAFYITNQILSCYLFSHKFLVKLLIIIFILFDT